MCEMFRLWANLVSIVCLAFTKMENTNNFYHDTVDAA